MRNTVVNVLDTLSATIANGQSLSGALNLGGLRLFGIVMPAAWTTASLTFQMSPDNGVTWNDMYDALGSEFVVAADVSRFIMLDPFSFSAVQWLKVRSGTAGTPVAQGADRLLNLVLRSV